MTTKEVSEQQRAIKRNLHVYFVSHLYKAYLTLTVLNIITKKVELQTSSSKYCSNEMIFLYNSHFLPHSFILHAAKKRPYNEPVNDRF